MRKYAVSFFEMKFKKNKELQLFNFTKELIEESKEGNLEAQVKLAKLEDAVRRDMKLANFISLAYLEEDKKIAVIVFGFLNTGEKHEVYYDMEKGKHFVEVIE